MNYPILLRPLIFSLCICVIAIIFICLNDPPEVAFNYLAKHPLEVDTMMWCIGVASLSIALWVFSPKRAHILLVITVLLLLIGGVGYTSAAVVILWLSGTTATGILVLKLCFKNNDFVSTSSSEAFIVGVAVWVCFSGLLIHFPVNYPWLYVSLCALPVLTLLFATRHTFRIFIGSQFRIYDRIDTIPFWQWSIGVAIIGWVMRWTNFPSLAYDDHAVRLRLFSELQNFRQAQFDVEAQIWSVAPFASDLIHATISNMVGSDSRGAVNLALSILLLTALARLLRMVKITSSAKWALIVLMASTPMLGNLLLSTQSELLQAVIALIGFRLALEARDGIFGPHVLGVMACAAMCAAIKLPAAVLGVTLLTCLALRLWDTRSETLGIGPQMRWPAFVFLLLLAFVALHSYVLAYIVTGNPVFPLYNGIFKSPYFRPENFSDLTWVHGFTLWNYIRAFFETSAFFESGNYVAGWQYLFILPIGLCTIWTTHDSKLLRFALIPLLGFGLVMFAATQYWRYLFPIMPIAIFVMSPLFAFRHRYLQMMGWSAVAMCIFLNLAFYKNVSWMMRSPAGAAYTQSGKERYIEIYAPVAALTERINQIATGSRVLYPSEAPYGAKLFGFPLYVNWYSPITNSQFRMLSGRQTVSDFLQKWDVDFVIMKSADTMRHSPEDHLRLYMAEFGIVKGQVGPFILYGVREERVPYRTIFDLDHYKRGTSDLSDLFLPVTNQGVNVTDQPKILSILDPQDANQLRYNIQFKCTSDTGYFVAQINWDVGPPYYRLVRCAAMMTPFSEAIPIPQSATQGLLYVTTRDNSAADVQDLTIELY